jgi:hypothetical protein
MANSFDSNFTRKLARVFLEKFETARVHSKNVNTQLLKGQFSPSSGDKVDFKRPTDYLSVRTAAGDVSGSSATDIITGKAKGEVQNYFTAFVDFSEADQAIKMDQLDQLLAPLATRICTDMELDFAEFMLKHTGMLAGTYGTAASTWDHVAEAGAVMQANGVPMDSPWYYTVNPYTQRNLASNQRSLGAGGVAGGPIVSAHEKATITEMFAGFDKVMTATTLPTVTRAATADVVGAVNGTMDVSYATHKDTMLQTITVDGFTAGAVIKAGSMVQVTGVYALNKSTRKPIIDDAGNKVLWTGVVQEDVTLTAGAGDLIIANPAIYEASGPYNTVDSAIANDDVITILGGTDAATFAPNLFWHKNAFGIGSVPIEKLYSTDTVATTEDGMQFRVSKYSDGDKNIQTVRFDFRPAYASLNPYFAGQGFGSS